MGYFSNGTEGMAYEEQYCVRCRHYGDPDEGTGCLVWTLHLLHSYEECNKPDSMLHMLIPRSKDGLGNEQCTMFLEDPNIPDPNQIAMDI